MPKVAVILAGCGRADGSEIHEAVSSLLHLSRLGASYQSFAPAAPQTDVVNHLTNEPAPGEKRNQLVEAARIARGAILPLERLDPGAFDAGDGIGDTESGFNVGADVFLVWIL